jgi:hypothetical protein
MKLLSLPPLVGYMMVSTETMLVDRELADHTRGR